MSKKSRRRNRRLLTALAALGGAAMLAGRGKKPNMDIPDRNRGMMPTGIDKVISDVPVSTPTTIQDSMPRVGMKMGDIRPKNVKSKRVTDKGEVFTIQDAKKGIAPKVGNKKTAFVNKDYIYQDGMPFTKGRFGTFKAKKEMERGMLPPQLRVPGQKNLTNVQSKTRNFFKNLLTPDTSAQSMSGLAVNDAAAKDGGKIVKTETGGKAVRPKKIKRIQIKGFGKARR